MFASFRCCSVVGWQYAIWSRNSEMLCASQNAINSNLTTRCCECVMHLLFIVDLEPGDFHYCGSLCKQSKGNPFQHEVETKIKVHKYVQMLSPYFFLAGIENAEYCCDKCISCSGSYVQKYRVCPLRLPVFSIFASGTVIDVAY